MVDCNLAPACLAIEFKTNFFWIQQIPIAEFQSLVNQDSGECFVLANWHLRRVCAENLAVSMVIVLAANLAGK
jgi:hypothetical protein